MHQDNIWGKNRSPRGNNSIHDSLQRMLNDISSDLFEQKETFEHNLASKATSNIAKQIKNVLENGVDSFDLNESLNDLKEDLQNTCRESASSALNTAVNHVTSNLDNMIKREERKQEHYKYKMDNPTSSKRKRRPGEPYVLTADEPSSAEPTPSTPHTKSESTQNIEKPTPQAQDTANSTPEPKPKTDAPNKIDPTATSANDSPAADPASSFVPTSDSTANQTADTKQNSPAVEPQPEPIASNQSEQSDKSEQANPLASQSQTAETNLDSNAKPNLVDSINQADDSETYANEQDEIFNFDSMLKNTQYDSGRIVENPAEPPIAAQTQTPSLNDNNVTGEQAKKNIEDADSVESESVAATASDTEVDPGDENVDVALSRSNDPSALIEQLQAEALAAYQEHLTQRQSENKTLASDSEAKEEDDDDAYIERLQQEALEDYQKRRAEADQLSKEHEQQVQKIQDMLAKRQSSATEYSSAEKPEVNPQPVFVSTGSTVFDAALQAAFKKNLTPRAELNSTDQEPEIDENDAYTAQSLHLDLLIKKHQTTLQQLQQEFYQRFGINNRCALIEDALAHAEQLNQIPSLQRTILQEAAEMRQLKLLITKEEAILERLNLDQMQLQQRGTIQQMQRSLFCDNAELDEKILDQHTHANAAVEPEQWDKIEDAPKTATFESALAAQNSKSAANTAEPAKQNTVTSTQTAYTSYNPKEQASKPNSDGVGPCDIEDDDPISDDRDAFIEASLNAEMEQILKQAEAQRSPNSWQHEDIYDEDEDEQTPHQSVEQAPWVQVPSWGISLLDMIRIANKVEELRAQKHSNSTPEDTHTSSQDTPSASGNANATNPYNSAVPEQVLDSIARMVNLLNSDEQAKTISEQESSDLSSEAKSEPHSAKEDFKQVAKSAAIKAASWAAQTLAEKTQAVRDAMQEKPEKDEADEEYVDEYPIFSMMMREQEQAMIEREKAAAAQKSEARAGKMDLETRPTQADYEYGLYHPIPHESLMWFKHMGLDLSFRPQPAADGLDNAADISAKLSSSRYDQLIEILDQFIEQRRARLNLAGLPVEQILTLPLIAVMGSAGAGKSTLCNQLLQDNVCKVCAYDTGTTQPEYHFLTVGLEPRICLVDMPGIGVNSQQMAESQKAIEFIKPRANVILWVINAQRRDLMQDCEFFTQQVRKNLRSDQKVFIVLNQVDNLSRAVHWNDGENRPAGDCLEMLDLIKARVADQYNVPESQILSLSAFTGYNISRLLQEVIFSLHQS